MQNIFLFRSEMTEEEFSETLGALADGLMADELFHHYFERYLTQDMFQRVIPVIRHTTLDVKYTLQHANKIEPVKFELVGDTKANQKTLRAILPNKLPITEQLKALQR